MWTNSTNFDEVCRRTGGRNRYNADRQLRATIRLYDVAQLLAKYPMEHGLQARIAEELGVSEATISRDIKQILYSGHICPTCDRLMPGELPTKKLKIGRKVPAVVIRWLIEIWSGLLKTNGKRFASGTLDVSETKSKTWRILIAQSRSPYC